jgi:hypothetical protein
MTPTTDSATLSQLREAGFTLYRDSRGYPYAKNYITGRLLRGETWEEVRNQSVNTERNPK